MQTIQPLLVAAMVVGIVRVAGFVLAAVLCLRAQRDGTPVEITVKPTSLSLSINHIINDRTEAGATPIRSAVGEEHFHQGQAKKHA